MEIVMNALMIFPKDLGKAIEEVQKNTKVLHICDINTGEIIAIVRKRREIVNDSSIVESLEFTSYGVDLLVSQLRGEE
jgi:hypothetical protein